MSADKINKVLEVIREVYPEELTSRQVKYFEWLIDQAVKIGGVNMSRAICDYLKIGHKPSRKRLSDLIERIINTSEQG